MTAQAVVVLVEGRSTGGDRRLRSFCHPVCCVCAARPHPSSIHYWTPDGKDVAAFTMDVWCQSTLQMTNNHFNAIRQIQLTYVSIKCTYDQTALL